MTRTSFPEKVKRHKVQHGVLDVVDLFFKWELQRKTFSYDKLFAQVLVLRISIELE